jgi:hypothetical protein
VTAPDADTRALHAALTVHLPPDATAWLDTALHDATAAAHDATAAAHDAAAAERADSPLPSWAVHFASAGRRCHPGGRSAPRHARRAGDGPRKPVAPDAPDDPATTPSAEPAAGELAEAARVLILHAARADAHTLARLYTRGSAAERRAVLRALPHLPHLGPDALPLVEDALRANDTRLIAAALGPYGAAHLPPDAWRQAVLKCLFTGVPLTAVASLADRTAGDAGLARMLTDYAAERTAAGRPVPDDLHHALALTGVTATATALPPVPAKES